MCFSGFAVLWHNVSKGRGYCLDRDESAIECEAFSKRTYHMALKALSEARALLESIFEM